MKMAENDPTSYTERQVDHEWKVFDSELLCG